MPPTILFSRHPAPPPPTAFPTASSAIQTSRSVGSPENRDNRDTFTIRKRAVSGPPSRGAAPPQAGRGCRPSARTIGADLMNLVCFAVSGRVQGLGVTITRGVAPGSRNHKNVQSAESAKQRHFVPSQCHFPHRPNSRNRNDRPHGTCLTGHTGNPFCPDTQLAAQGTDQPCPGTQANPSRRLPQRDTSFAFQANKTQLDPSKATTPIPRSGLFAFRIKHEYNQQDYNELLLR